MKYKYNMFWYIVQCLLVLLFLCGLVLLLSYFSKENEFFNRPARKGFIFAFGMLAFYSVEYLNRYVEIFEKHVRFNSFRIKFKFKPVYLDFMYEDIISVTSTAIPLFGIYKINVKVNNYDSSIPITFSFRKHNELFSEIVRLAEKYNSDVYIDERLIEHLKKKNLYHHI